MTEPSEKVHDDRRPTSVVDDGRRARHRVANATAFALTPATRAREIRESTRILSRASHRVRHFARGNARRDGKDENEIETRTESVQQTRITKTKDTGRRRERASEGARVRERGDDG